MNEKQDIEKIVEFSVALASEMIAVRDCYPLMSTQEVFARSLTVAQKEIGLDAQYTTTQRDIVELKRLQDALESAEIQHIRDFYKIAHLERALKRCCPDHEISK